MTKSQPLVSVLCTVYNEVLYIKKMISSLSCQSYCNLEVIVVDDGSNDGTADVLRSEVQEKSWLKVVFLTSNKGKAFAQNVAFDNAIGDYICLHGGDDESHPDRIKRQLEFLLRYDLDCCITQISTCDEEGVILEKEFSKFISFTKSPEEILKGSSFPAGTIMMSKSRAETVYPLPTSLPYEDRWITFKIQKNCKALGFVSSPLYFYRQHKGNSYLLKNGNSYLLQFSALKKMKERDFIVDKVLFNEFSDDEQSELKWLFCFKEAMVDRLKSNEIVRFDRRVLLSNRISFGSKAFYFSPSIIFFIHHLKSRFYRNSTSSIAGVKVDGGVILYN
ncbi:glycosyltransferase family 2 protein [Halomonas urmiana]|uniref:Glycosyltransferase family 2 protein n=1 Tax=Halomonas urmiana TaxID=490901 RepID=A0A5R8M8M0_9GAMM|nr:glycosyltransferase family A protein [Halomonas urmiana]TLF45904.1 glycosyltransferase family 2 protein [Halomonas urmiana]